MLRRTRRRLLLAAAGTVPFLATILIARFRFGPGAACADFVGPRVSWALSRLSAPFPFALIEVLFAAWLAWRLTAVVRGARAVRLRQIPFREAFASFALVLAQDAGVGVGLFYATWGFNYARASIEETLAWPEDQPPEELLEALAEAEVIAANESYRELHGRDDAEAPTTVPDLGRLDAALEEGWHSVVAELGLGEPVRARHGRFKRLWISPLLRRAGLAGFYAPFTGEANVNRSVPAVSLPQVIAHEKAHQRAIAPEDEANFLGYLAAVRSSDPLARYSAHVFAQRQLLRALMRTDRERAETLVGRRLPGVQRDVDDLHEYWAVSRGRAGRVTRAVNNAYLKTNRVEGGVASYGGSLELLLRFASARGGSLGVGSDDDHASPERAAIRPS